MKTLRDEFEAVVLDCHINRSFIPLYEFIESESKSLVFSWKRREFLELIPEFVKHITRATMGWLNLKRVNQLDGFTEQVKKGLYELDAYQNGVMYSSILFAIDTENFYDEELVTHLAEKDLIPEDMINILKDICLSNNKLGSLFVKKISSKEITPDIALNLLRSIMGGYSENYLLPLYENIDFFMEHLDNTLDLYNKVDQNEDAHNKVKEYMKENIDEVLTKVRPSQLVELATIYDGEIRTKIVNYALDHFSEILNDYSPLSIFDSMIKDLQQVPELEQKRIEYVNENFNEIAKKMYCYINYNATKENVLSLEQSADREAIVDIIKMVFEEVAANENVNYSDIKMIGRGAYVCAFQVGEKVVKLGKSRAIQSYPNNPYVLTPLIRKTFAVKGAKKYEGAFVEVIERVDTLKDDEVSEEELYTLYSRMRDIGLEWMDIEARNVGLLRRDNRIYWNEELDPSDEALGLLPKVGAGIHLKKGDLVILDDDFIFEEGSIPKEITETNEDEEFGFVKTWKKFNERYNKEHYGIEPKRSSTLR